MHAIMPAMSQCLELVSGRRRKQSARMVQDLHNTGNSSVWSQNTYIGAGDDIAACFGRKCDTQAADVLQT